MPFEKGHKLSTGRPKGSLNKANSETKEFIHDILYNEEDWLTEWKTLDIRTKFEMRCRLAPFIFQKPNTKIDIANQEKPWGNQVVMRVDGDDSEVTEAEKAFLWELHDGNLPLFLRKDIYYHAENKDTFYSTNDNLTGGE